MTDTILRLGDELKLSCGAVLPNRLAKAAMTEGLADPLGRASEGNARVYERWSKGGSGLILTGNIQVDRRSLERAGNIRIEGAQDAEKMRRLSRLAEADKVGGNHFWAQIAHAGRQAPADACPDRVAPSAVPMKMLRWTQKAPRALMDDEIEDIIRRFGSAAKIAQDAGFDGVEIHGAHGYLISEFLSPTVKLRTDRRDGVLENRARFLLEVIREVRRSVGDRFPVGLKLNSADFQKGGFTHDDSLRVVESLNNEGIDLLEITGGTYEHLSMIGVKNDNQFEREPPRTTTAAREAYFAVYAADARRIAKMPVMATGGFRNRETMVGALNDGTCDMIGLGRPLCADHDVSRKLIIGETDTTMTRAYTLSLSGQEKEGLSEAEIQVTKVLGQQAFFFLTLFDLADGRNPDLSRNLPAARAE
jgi:2,4-dienoyl-CoA reductase-like NADH-dependent reductase (Old Yellow Enzyme family)